jgi:glycosyltransferase involved in cell wall biosynthesis
MNVSVIISTYNSPDWLTKVLVGYRCQTVSGFEVLIADDGSGEETQAAVSSFDTQGRFTLSHVWQADDGFQKCRILNKAIGAAAKDYLIFTDGDCIPEPGLVASHLKHADRKAFLSGGYCKLPMKTSKRITQEDIETGRIFKLSWLFSNGFGVRDKWLKVAAPGLGLSGFLDRVSPAKKTFNGNNSSCYRDDALAVGGFDERMGYGGEDREFGYRLENAGLKAKVIRYSALCLHLDHPRGYKDETIRLRNEEIIASTKSGKTIFTSHGIEPRAI